MIMWRTVGARLRTNWQDPLIRRHVGLLFLGKAIGLAIVLTLMTRWFLPALLGAQAATPAPAPALDPMATVNAINTVWTLVAAFLVFCMQVGFVLLEAGFARSRESVNILVEGIADTCICGVTFWLWGFEHGVNERGVVIGNEAIWTKAPRQRLGLLGIQERVRLARPLAISTSSPMHRRMAKAARPSGT